VPDDRSAARGARGIGALVIVCLSVALVVRYLVHDDVRRATPDAASTGARYESSSVSATIHAMSSGSDFMLAVGDDGTIARHRLAGMWSSDASPTHARLRAVAQQLDEAIAVGDDGVIVELDGGEWRLATSPTTRSLRAIVYTSYGAFAAGDRGTIVRRPAIHEPWHIESSGTTSDLYAACAGLRDVWVVGQSGTIALRGFEAWKAQPPISSTTLYAISCDDHAAIAVGEHGTILQGVDAVWHLTPSGLDANLLAVSGSVGTTSWLAAGTAGVVLRVSSGGASQEPTGIAWDIHAVTEGPFGTWVGGEKGILHRTL
jgi:hypothetical protein